MAFIKVLSRGLQIAALLIAVDASAQVSFVEEIEPLEGVIIPKSASPAPAAPPAPIATPLAPKLEIPSSKAEHLHNPAPDYPRMSVKLGEQGQVMVRVFIGADGVPQKVELQTSSGFGRLDKAGMEAAMRWRYVPGKRRGVAEAMWFLQDINFNLKKNEK